jgi:hypothetical protein
MGFPERICIVNFLFEQSSITLNPSINSGHALQPWIGSGAGFGTLSSRIARQNRVEVIRHQAETK